MVWHLKGEFILKKLVICALALGGFAASVQAADLGLDSMKDPLPDNLTYKGVTVYGAIDVGYAYQTKGAPVSGALATGLEYNMFGSANNRQAISSVAPSGLSQSFVGVKAEESFAPGWTVLAKAESGFVPTSGELADGCASLARANGVDNAHSAAKGDSSRCGQLFNGPAYAGVSSSAYGTVTIGRQNTLELDLIAAYDPLALSYAFSLIGYSGGAGAGIGDTEAGRWDNSVKYVYQYGPVHASFMYANGSQDTAVQTGAAAGGAGFTWKGLSVDVLYTKQDGSVSGSTLSSTDVGNLTKGFSLDKTLNATISDNQAWTVGAKYTFDLGGGGWKDYGSGAKFTVFGGYQHTDMTNPSDPVASGSTTIGGYRLFVVNNNAFDTTKELQTAWAGAKYEVGPWSFTGAYYHLDQNSWVARSADGKTVTAKCSTNAHSNCSGNFDMGSFVVDYAFNKHFDVYAGVNYSAVDGGLSSGFLATDSTLFMTGARLKF
jgi:predicted porin